MENHNYMLIADDAGEFRDTCKAALEAKGFEVEVCRKDGRALFGYDPGEEAHRCADGGPNERPGWPGCAHGRFPRGVRRPAHHLYHDRYGCARHHQSADPGRLPPITLSSRSIPISLPSG